MSPEVRILPQTLINKIAAGEVIVRPASVVKELVENSFDAGATRIRVEVSQDGRSISVIDDGCGMDEENAKRAILRHSTSKIQEFEDLLKLATRGFRGEALASIISVSRFEMMTCMRGQLSGTRLVAAGGKVESMEPVGAPTGTTIHVRDLFYNTPARLKFLKSASAEFNVLAQILTQQALTHPEIGITCVRAGETRFDLPPGQTLLERAEGLLGPSVRGQMIEVDYEREGLSIRGYICRPEASRKDRRWQYLMVNGRPIAAKQLTYPMQEAYGSLLMTQRYPVVVLNIDLDPGEVDINVHPTKEEVRFEEEKKVAGLLHRAISLALRAQNLMPIMGQAALSVSEHGPILPVASGSRPVAEPSADRLAACPTDPSLPFLFSPQGLTPFQPGERVLKGLTGPGGQMRDMFGARREDGAGEKGPEDSGRFMDGMDSMDSMDGMDGGGSKDSRDIRDAVAGDGSESGRVAAKDSGDSLISITRASAPGASTSGANTFGSVTRMNTSGTITRTNIDDGADTCEGPPREAGELDAPSAASLYLADGNMPMVLGQLARTYILADWNNHLLLIDQHAAHERLVYKRLREGLQKEIPMQPFLAPIPIEVAPADLDALDMLVPVLREMGIDIRKEGMQFAVHALPADFDSLDVGALIQDILDGIQNNGSVKKLGVDDLRDRVQIRMACHGAIRAGQQLHTHEMDALIRQIVEAKLSFTCPHGRPTMVLLRKDQLDRQFGRK